MYVWTRRSSFGEPDWRVQVWSLDTYEQLHTVPAHKGAVLGLFLSEDGKLLFSCAGDAIVNVCRSNSVSPAVPAERSWLGMVYAKVKQSLFDLFHI